MKKAKPKEPFDRVEWDFSSVPKNELSACFLWEYARESSWICALKDRSVAFWQGGGKWEDDPELDNDIRLLQNHLPYESEVFLSGFFFDSNRETQSVDPKAENYKHPEAPPITGSFPAPWQTLSQSEREYRSHIRNDIEAVPLVPFRRGHDFQCDLIRDSCNKERARQLAENEYSKEIRSSILWEGGAEEGIFQIEWGSFTNKTIADYFLKWLKENRPTTIPEPSKNGDKTEDRRAWLKWLGTMRALHRFSFADYRFPSDLRNGGDSKETYAMRTKAKKKFDELFSFLPEQNETISYPTRGKGG